MERQIIFYAPLGKEIPKEKIGGAEAGCLKTKKIYEDAGFDVEVLEKPAMSKGKVRFVFEMLVTPLHLLWLCKKHGKGVPVHIVGFYAKIVSFEHLLMRVAHLCGNKVIYELRNGSMLQTYKEGSKKYRKTLENLLLQPEVVLCQGREYVDFIREQWGMERCFYPNFILDEFVFPNNTNRPKPVQIIYFGRVTESKNVDVTIKALAEIRKAGINAYLDIIGGYNENYKAFLDSVAKKTNVTEFVAFYGRRPFSFIAEKLRKSHYFLFPSTEKQEGHSNSLTEAMGCGVVPIVSTAGFNRSICGNKKLVVEKVDAKNLAEKVIEIENSNSWSRLSVEVYNHILNNYTESIVSKKLIEFIEPLFL